MEEIKETLRQRMYHLVLYSLSGIQQGIQAGHAVNEYQLLYGNSTEYQQWSRKDKVVIILNGGTSNNIGYDVWGNECTGTMETHLQSLKDAGILATPFYEPDLNNAMSAIAFLVDERVWDKKTYSEPTLEYIQNKYSQFEKPTIEATAEIILKFFTEKYGAEVAFLRTWLKQFKLA